MKILYIGGVKSGKSYLAMQKALELSLDSKPLYLATTDRNDASMQKRIALHKQERGEQFETLEEPLEIDRILDVKPDIILIDCLTLWINNMMFHEKNFETMNSMLESILTSHKSVIFVLNDVGSGIHADTELGRKFTDISGLIAQKVARECDEVYHCLAGIGNRIK